MVFRRTKIIVFCLALSLLFTPVTVLAQDQAPKAPLSYENSEMGVKILGPAGWFVTSSEKAEQIMAKGVGEITNLESIKEAIKKVGILVMFSEYQFGSPVEYNPSVALVTESIPEGFIKTPVDYANASLMNIRTIFKDVKVIVAPKEFKIGTRDAAHFVYEGTMVRGYLEIRIKSSAYFFIKGKIGYTLTCTDKADHYNNNAAKFSAVANSFILK